MTKREFDIYKIIKNEPLISQNEIAARLGITRSAVSSYLVAMIKKGIIKGRGYIINSDQYPLLVGPGHIDIVSLCSGMSSRPGLYNSKKTTISYGGAIKNIAHYLARLEINPRAIFTASADFFGSQFLKDCSLNGIDADDSLIMNDISMPIYNEIATESGEIIASANMEDNLAHRLTPDFLKTKESVFRGATQIVVHDTLSYESIEYISSAFNDSTLIYFSIYYNDTVQHMDLLNRFHTIIMSYSTALQLTGGPKEAANAAPNDNEIRHVCTKLQNLGIKNAIILCSLNQTCWMDESNIIIQTTSSESTADRQGYRFYRDASVASIIFSMQRGYTPEESMNHLAASKLIAASSSNFIDTNYCQSLVENMSARLTSTFTNLKQKDRPLFSRIFELRNS